MVRTANPTKSEAYDRATPFRRNLMPKKPLDKKMAHLPKGFKAASPIKNKRLRELVMGPDITTSGGFNTKSAGLPLVKRQRANG